MKVLDPMCMCVESARHKTLYESWKEEKGNGC